MIAITQQQKEEWERELKKLNSAFCIDQLEGHFISGQMFVLEELLSKAIVLPVEEHWGIVGNKSMQALIDDKVKEGQGIFEVNYPNGVIIKSK